MTKAIKYRIVSAAVLLGVLAECVGVYDLAGGALTARRSLVIKGAVLVIAGFVIGIPAALARQYINARADDLLSQQTVAVETLAKLAVSERAARSRNQKS